MSSVVPRRCVSGDEVDAYSRRSRRIHSWGRGELAQIKRGTSKRERREGAAEARREAQA